MKLKNKTIGIWGFGRVGKSAAQFCLQQGANILIYDKNQNTLEQCLYQCTQSLEDFFNRCDAIIPSPGIDISIYSGTWLFELDLFHSFFHKKIIAVTGSVGKTSVTHMLTQTLQAAGWNVKAAGNIGIPMLSMLEKQNELDAVVLELSSFQLEHIKKFAPDLAIWTNLYPNHLDRHHTIDKYFNAKYQILAHQNKSQYALLPLQLQSIIQSRIPQSAIHYFDPMQPPNYSLSGFPVNWLIVEKAVELLHSPFPQAITITPLEHRLETVCVIRGATIINDSKSTTPASTSAAIESLQASRILLFLGGLSKGIDRSELIQSLGKNVQVLCFGAESEMLFDFCKRYSIPASSHETMKKAVAHCMNVLQPEDIVLFSPSGSSFDEFNDFEERGTQFKKIILSYKN